VQGHHSVVEKEVLVGIYTYSAWDNVSDHPDGQEAIRKAKSWSFTPYPHKELASLDPAF
jgi:hypothetical protein